MKITFWGVRGSIPAPLSESEVRDKMHRLLNLVTVSDDLSSAAGRDSVISRFTKKEPLVVGGNTTCIELLSESKMLIFDMGTGIRRLGNQLVASNGEGISEFHIFLSHTHWDHINGFPFFLPAYLPNYKLNFYSVHSELKEKLEIQQDPRFFPVKLEQMASLKRFVQLKENCDVVIGNINVKNQLLFHPGNSYGYSITSENKKIVIATDSEYKNNSLQSVSTYLEFFKDADVLVFDSQYSFAESIHKANWGHSSAIMGIDIAIEANVKKLVLFHHEPENTDEKLINMLKQAIQYKKVNFPDKSLDILIAREGMSIEV